MNSTSQNKHGKADAEFISGKNGNLVLKYNEIAYHLGSDRIDNTIKRYKNHPSIKTSKEFASLSIRSLSA